MNAAATGESPRPTTGLTTRSGTGPATRLSAGAPAALSDRPRRRVREEVRDGLAVVVVSAFASTALALLLVVLTAVVS